MNLPSILRHGESTLLSCKSFTRFSKCCNINTIKGRSRSLTLSHFTQIVSAGVPAHWTGRLPLRLDRTQVFGPVCRLSGSAAGLDSSPTNAQPDPSSTLDPQELANFRKLSQQFWQENGDFQALHRLNDLRVPLIRDSMLKQKSGSTHSHSKPLHGATIVDVGCGGGILAEPLARLGATVIGIDATPENIEVAQHHLSHDPTIRGRLKYIHGTASDLVGTESEGFDAVVCSEVLEHVNQQEDFLKTCVQLAKPGGTVIVTTVNKTWLSYALGIVMAERVLGLVPDGTHDWNKFVSPDQVQTVLEQNGCQVRLTHGMLYNPLTRRWGWTADTSLSYAMCGTKASL